MVLLIKHCEAQDLPGSGLASSTAALPHDVLSLPQGPQPSPGTAAAPAVAAPSMKEVEQAVQEASEQVEGGGAEEVLKGLLERVVEAALGEAEGEQQGGAGAGAGAGAAAAAVGGAGEGEAEAAADGGVGGTVEQASEGEGAGLDGGLGAAEGGLDGEEQQEAETGESDAETAGAETDAVGADGGTGSESEEATEAGVEDETAVATPPAASEDTPPVVLVVEPTDILEKMEKQVEEMIIKAGGEEVLKPSIEGAGGDSTKEGTERGGAGEEQLDATEEQTGGETEGGTGELGGGEAAQQPGGDVEAKEESSHVHGAVGVQLPPGGDGGEDSERVGEQEQEGATENEADEEEVEAGGLDGNRGLAGAVGEAEDGEGGAGTWGNGAVGPGEDEGVALNREEVVTLDGDAATEPITESSQTGQTKEQDVLALSPGASEHGAGDQAPPVQEQDSLPRPTLVWGETGSEHVDREDPLLQGTNHTNEIPTTDHLFTHGPAVATEAYQDLMEQALATPPETEEAEPGEANELVTDAAGPSEGGLLGVEAWKIGGIAAAVIVGLETLLIVVYILKCRTGAKSAPVPGACEKGHVEPETPTGGDCIDDYLPASNGDTQLIAELEPSGGKLHQEPQQLALSDLPPSPTELLPSAGLAEGSSYDLRTSDL
ncbi:unnamed protein product [Boreogadus saida]